jgi:hypothetical protein
MMPPKAEQICSLLRSMPAEDQLPLLLVAIVEANPDALSIAQRMLGATGRLSEHLSAEKRFKVSDAMRDLADRLEQPLGVVTD